MRKSRFSFLFLVPFVVVTVTTSARDSDKPAGFVHDVRPILQKHCYACHGPVKQKSGLRLDIKSEAMKGGELYGPSIIPNNASRSPLIEFVSREDADLMMPPEGERLSATEIAVLQRWIDEGAVWPDGVDSARVENRRDHWSFQPVARPDPPEPRSSTWPINDIDRFVLARLDQEGLRPMDATDRVTWLRRVSFDLIGLPPSPEDAQAFLDDDRSDAYERCVDRLLSSPRYGERWAQHWLDVVRYADTHGFEVNTERPHAWPYRDYVIESLNQDTPYDQFIREQIVGDALGKDAATGFLITASVLLPGQIGQDAPSMRAARQDALDEVVVNIGQTFLGLSIGCARCHDHKFDPVSQQNYYEMQAFVAGVEYADRPLRTPEAEQRKREALPLEGLTTDDRREAEKLREQQKKLEEKLAEAVEEQLVFAGEFREPDVIRLLRRGDPEQPQEVVVPAVPDVIGSLELSAETPEQQRRIALADWIASPDNPLSARVMVNRIWQGHFGTGLVDTPNDFGRNGAKPSHPELLDWLASEFIRSGWSIKHMHRSIVLSAAYRQSTRPDEAAAAKDAEARLLWRFPSRRLEGETIRDSILAVSGRLNLKVGGPGFDLFDKRGGLSGFEPIDSFEEEGLRRMIYAHKIRRERDAVFGAFDCPDGGQSTAKRRQTTTPMQALNLFNSRFTLDNADAFAARIKSDVPDDVAQQIRRAYRIALCREPSADEVLDAEAAVNHHGLSLLCRVLINCNEFLFIP